MPPAKFVNFVVKHGSLYALRPFDVSRLTSSLPELDDAGVALIFEDRPENMEVHLRCQTHGFCIRLTIRRNG